MSAHQHNDRFEPIIGEWSLAVVPVGEQEPDPLPDVGARASFEDFDLVYTRVSG